MNCVLFNLMHAELDLDDQCLVARSGINGICRFYDDCPMVLDELLNQGLIPAKCGYKDRKEIICCPAPVTPKPTMPPQQTNRISAKSKQNIQFLQ